MQRLETPAIVIDLEQVERNLSRMQRKATSHGVRLRPHLKTHKIPELARRQIGLGACGVTVSKVSEAEVMAAAGIPDIFIANQIVAPEKVERLLSLSRRINLSVGLDSSAGALILSRVFAHAGATIDYLIEIDSGLERCGVQPGEAAIDLYLAAHRLPGIRFKGIFTHAGHAYGQGSLEEVRRVSRQESAVMVETARCFQRRGIDPGIVSVGSTPTVKVWEGCDGITELRPGNYIFNDAIQVGLGVASPEECALTILATVISRPEPRRAVIDAGSKTLGLDKGAHGKVMVKGHGIVLGLDAVLERLSEEHGILSLGEGEDLKVGDVVRIIPNHACTVINLFDIAYGSRAGRVAGEFRIAARGTVR